MTQDEFAESVKAKYPAYKDVDNATLVAKVIEKYPQYQSQINTPAEAVVPKKTLGQKVSNTIQSIFPGQKVGQAIGTLAGYAGSKNKEFYDTTAPTPLQVAGDIGQGALTVAAPGIGGQTAGARIAANAALGAGIGATGGIAEGESIGQVGQDALVGGVAGGALSGVAEGLLGLAKNAPRWFTKLALPKLRDIPEEKFIANKAGGFTKTPQDMIDYTLQNTKVGSLKSIYGRSNESINNYGKQISNILEHPEYAKEVGVVKNAIPELVMDFTDAQLDAKKAVSIVKQVVPGSKTLVDKVADGTATLKEQNALRQALDKATKKIFSDNPNVSFNKEIAAGLANKLRSNVQTTAPETAEVFNTLSKELNLNNAVLQAAKKRQVLGDLIAGGAGYAAGGVKGAVSAIALERTVRSPAALLAGAKAIKAAGKAGPTLNSVTRGTKSTIIKKIAD